MFERVNMLLDKIWNIIWLDVGRVWTDEWGRRMEPIYGMGIVAPWQTRHYISYPAYMGKYIQFDEYFPRVFWNYCGIG